MLRRPSCHSVDVSHRHRPRCRVRLRQAAGRGLRPRPLCTLLKLKPERRDGGETGASNATSRSRRCPPRSPPPVAAPACEDDEWRTKGLLPRRPSRLPNASCGGVWQSESEITNAAHVSILYSCYVLCFCCFIYLAHS